MPSPIPESELRSFILENTVVTTPHLCPEIRLRLVTEECGLFRCREEDLEEMGIPSPFWAFCWAGGEALARHLLDHSAELRGRRVLDFGAGGGVAAIAAALAGARVTAADIDPIAIRCLRLNAELNQVEIETTTEDLLGRADLPFDVVLVGDVTYDPELAERVVDWLSALARRGVRVLLGDPSRGWLPEGSMREVAEYRAPADNDTGLRSLARTPIYEVSAEKSSGP